MKSKQFTILVTGYSGFIGQNFTKRVLDLGWIVYGVDINKQPGFAYENFIHYGDDICELKNLPDCDFIVNFAAQSHVSTSIENCKEFIRTNVDGVRNILDLIRKRPKNVTNDPLFCQISTDECYSDSINGERFTEESPLNPSNPYSVSKAAADMLIKAYHRTYGLEYLIIRPTNNYGIHQIAEKLIPLTIKLALSERKINLHDRGEPKRTWLHVEDTVDAILLLLLCDKRGIYNVSGDTELKNIEVVTKILKHMEYVDEEIEKMYNLNFKRPGQDIRYHIDDTKLRNLGWTNRRNFENELPKIINWYLDEPIVRLFDERNEK